MNHCDRKRSFMTPCVLDDGPICLTDLAVCVGCGKPGEEIELNVRQTAKALGVHENTVRLMVRDGRLRSLTMPLSGYSRFPSTEVARVLATREDKGSYPKT